MDPDDSAVALRLLQGVAKHGRLHVDELQSDLHQLEALISDAVSRMSGTFSRLAELVAPVAEVRDRSDSEAPSSVDRLAEIEATARTLAVELQFHDMSCQIAARAKARLAGMVGMLGALAAASSPTRASGAPMEAVEQQLGQASHELTTRLRQTVVQRGLHPGDIELF